MPPAPTTEVSTGERRENSLLDSDEFLDKSHETDEDSNPPKYSENSKDVPLKIYWVRVVLWAIYHLIAAYGIYLMFTSAKWQTNVLAFFMYIGSSLGITAGAHRLWCHRAYKAKLPLRIFLAYLVTIAFQKDIYRWSRDHRLHHKYNETHPDPYNPSRGLFYAHIGWLMMEKHPDVNKKGRLLDLTDLLEDPVVRFHKKYFLQLVFLFGYLLPTMLPMYLWNETFINAYCLCVFRHCLAMHVFFLINSAAHKWGYRPIDVNINPGDITLVSIVNTGEGFHNYHHAFPYDYSASELGIKYNLATAFIDLMAYFGLAYDLKTASKSVIEARKLRTGPESLKNMQVKNGNLSHKID